MNEKKMLSGIIMLLLLLVSVHCVKVQTRASEPQTAMHTIKIPPEQFVAPSDQKLWEGVIEERSIAYFRSSEGGNTAEVVVVIQDDLPRYFKRIEYLDKKGDGNVDLVKMKIYEAAKGWREVGITRDNKYGLGFADNQYKEILKKIRNSGLDSQGNK